MILIQETFNLRSFAERTAINTPIQGSAADIFKKIAMIEMARRLKEEKNYKRQCYYKCTTN